MQTIQSGGQTIAVYDERQKKIASGQDALDLIAEVYYQLGCSRVAIAKQALGEDFFVLSTRLAGEILQKFVNYQVKAAIYGDFSGYTSKPLKDFMVESNRGGGIFFTDTLQQAVQRLAEG
ncbi:MAG: DUF4180 domain-containing protein [Oscillospiraceae bacterium]